MLAVGDAFLLARGAYHWSYAERGRRMASWHGDEPEHWRDAYCSAVALKVNWLPFFFHERSTRPSPVFAITCVGGMSAVLSGINILTSVGALFLLKKSMVETA